jgi:hypothetical protein
MYVPRLTELISLSRARDVRQIAEAGMDIVLYSLLKGAGLLARCNGNVLENLFEPQVVEHPSVARLRRIVRQDIICQRFFDHYHGYAGSTYKRFAKSGNPEDILHSFRVLLTGIHLLRTGKVECNIHRLSERYGVLCMGEILTAYSLGRRLDILRVGREFRLFDQALLNARCESALRAEPRIDRLENFVQGLIIGGV